MPLFENDQLKIMFGDDIPNVFTLNEIEVYQIIN